MPHFDWTISFGQIVEAVLFIIGMYGAAMRIYNKIEIRMKGFEDKLEVHAKTLTDHASRLTRYEETLFRIVGDLQRVVGRVEVQSEQRRRDGA